MVKLYWCDWYRLKRSDVEYSTLLDAGEWKHLVCERMMQGTTESEKPWHAIDIENERVNVP